MVNSIARRVARNGIQTAPDYEDPIDDDPIDPPVGEPDPPTDTPLDADNDNEPEPGIDADYVAPDRIEIVDNKQAVVRTTTDPGTWGNAYVANSLTGPEYWEVEVAASTPNNATLAIGVSTLAMPLNGIPGALAGTIAYWSDGTVRQNNETLMTLATYGRKDRIGVSYDADGGVRLFKNCTPLNGGASVGTLSGSPRFPFVGMYSANTRTAFKFAMSRFGCTLPDEFFPIGQVPAPPYDVLALTGLNRWYDPSDATSVTLASGAVSQLNDKSTNNYHLTQSTGSARPTMSTISGLACLNHNGTQYLLSSAGLANLTGTNRTFTFVAVVNAASVAEARAIANLNNSATGNPFVMMASFNASSQWNATKRDDAGGTIARAGGTALSATNYVVAVTFNGSTITMRVNGSVVINAQAFSGFQATINRFTLGAWFQITSLFNGWDGKIGETILCTGALGSAELTGLESYLASKWGVTLP